MRSEGILEIVGSLGVIVLTMIGLGIIVRGLVGGASGAGAQAARGGTVVLVPGQHVLGRAATTFLSFAVAYKFVVERYVERTLGFEAMVVTAFLLLLGMTIVPALETAVAVTALTFFLMNNVETFGGKSLLVFFGLFVLFAVVRRFLGR
jgi:hypothetical protein